MEIREARLADARAIATVHVTSWQLTYGDLLPDAFLSRMTINEYEQQWMDNLIALGDVQKKQCAFVAENTAGEIIGYVWAGSERSGLLGYDGQFYKMYILEEYHRMGVGRRLTLAVVRRFIEFGFTSMHLPVFAANKASRRFFEVLNGEPILEKPIRIGEIEIEEITYAWRELEDLEQTLVSLLGTSPLCAD